MSIADQMKQMDLREARMNEMDDFKRSIGLLLKSEDGMWFPSEQSAELYYVDYYYNYENVSEMFKEAVSLVNEDSWNESDLVFSPECFRDNQYYGKCIRSKIKAPDGRIYLFVSGVYYVSPHWIKHKFYNPYYKQVTKFLKEKITYYYDNLRSHFFGSQKYIEKNGIYLFQDGYCAVNPVVTMTGGFPHIQKNMSEIELRSVEAKLADLVRSANHK